MVLPAASALFCTATLALLSFEVAVIVRAAISKGTLTAYSVVLALKAGESSASATLSAFRVASEEPDLLIVFVPEELELEELELELDELEELDDIVLL